MVQGKNHYLVLIVLIPCNTWKRLKRLSVYYMVKKIPVFGVIHGKTLNSWALAVLYEIKML